MTAYSTARRLADTTEPELAAARRVLAAEESSAPLGMDVLVLDLAGQPVSVSMPLGSTTKRQDRELSRQREASNAFWEGAFAACPAGRGLMAVAVQLCLGAPAVYVEPLGGGPTVVLSPDWSGMLATWDMAITPAHRRLVRATHRGLLEEARDSGGNTGRAAERALAAGRLPLSRSGGRSRGATMARSLTHEIGHRRTAQALGSLAGLSLTEARAVGGRDAPPEPWGTPLGTRVLAAGNPPSLYAAENPLEWIAEAWVLSRFGGCDAGNEALVREVRECVREGRTWTP